MSRDPGHLPARLGDLFRVADWEIDVASHRMRRDGETVRLEPRTMAVLVHLAARAGEVVTREELEQEVWSGRVVGYEALSNAIAKLRRAFEDDPRQPRVIETVPKAGYRLVAEVERIAGTPGPKQREAGDLRWSDAGPGAPAGRSPEAYESPEPGKAGSDGEPRRGAANLRLHLVTTGAVALVLLFAAGTVWLWQGDSAEPRVASASPAGKPSVAVLPFENLSDDPAQDFFADGLTGDLITDLSRISGLFVIARHSVFAYEDQSRSIAEIADELGVRYVVEGSVRRTGGQVRIDVQLIDTVTGMKLWTKRYEREEMGVFALRDDVIRDIVDTLAIELTDAERKRLARPGTDDLEAYDYYLRAEHHWNTCGPADCQRAFDLYRQAVRLDPGYVDAYAGIAQAARLTWRWDWTEIMPGATARRLAYDAASKVLSLDENDPRAYTVIATIQAVEARHEQALESARSAVRLDPNSADAHATLAWILTITGDHAAARSEMEAALRLNPKPPAWYNARLGIMAFLRHDYETAIAQLSRGGEYYQYRRWQAMAYAELGRLDEARAEMEPVYENAPFANLAYFRTLSAHFKRDEDLEHMLAALEKAGLPEWPYGYEPIPEHRLDGRALEKITYGHTWTGRDSRGNRFAQQWTDDGRTAFRGRASLLTGSFRLEGNRLCVEFPGTLLGREDCGYVYRNPDGTKEQQDQFIRVSVGDIYYFSVSPN